MMMPIEYLRNVDQGMAYLNAKAPELFGQSYARSLAGLLLSATLLALIASLVSSEGRERKPGTVPRSASASKRAGNLPPATAKPWSKR